MEVKFSPEERSRMRGDVCYFTERMLRTPEREPFVPHPAQKEFMECKSDIVVGCFGRQSGKSMGVSAILLHTALYKYGSNQLVVSGTYKNASIIFDMMAAIVNNSPIVYEQVLRIVRTPYPQIVFRNGSHIKFLTVGTGSDNWHIRGETAHRIVVDEAASLKDSVVDEVLMPMLVRHAGQLILISTPFGRNYFFRYFEEGNKDTTGKIKSFHFNSYSNPHLDKERLDWIHAHNPDLVWRQEYLAEFIDDAAFVFPWRIIQPCLSDEVMVSAGLAGHSYVMGVDIARVKDYSAICVLDVTDSRRVRVAYFERFNESSISVNNYWEYCANRIVAVAESFQPFRVVVDSSSAGNPILEWITAKVPQAEEYKFANSKSNPKKVLLVNQLVLGFQQQRVALPNSLDYVIDELRYFSYKLTEEQNMQMMAAEGHHDDTVMAFCLAWMCVSGPEGEVGVMSLDRHVEAPKVVDNGFQSMVLGGKDSSSSGNPFSGADNFGAWRKWGN